MVENKYIFNRIIYILESMTGYLALNPKRKFEMTWFLKEV